MTTYAFIQFIDPICSISAHDNEQNCSIDGHTLKVGFGRATPSDCLWVGGVSEKDLTEIGNMFGSFTGYKCALTDTHLLQTIIKFQFIADCVVAYDHAGTLKKYPKLLVDFLSYYGANKFIQRMYDSDQIVDESYLKFHIVVYSKLG
uniref:Protein split ends (Trinotate prediction) n=1 Tax=Myxobolus squamalis TaxID=59785 RepID=A0A6B2G0T3_MYXSQ